MVERLTANERSYLISWARAIILRTNLSMQGIIIYRQFNGL